MTLTELLALARDGGSFAIIVTFLVATAQGRLLWKREADNEKLHRQELLKMKDEQIANLERQLLQQREDFERRLLDERKQKDEFRGIALRQTHTVSQAVTLAKTAVEPGQPSA